MTTLRDLLRELAIESYQEGLKQGDIAGLSDSDLQFVDDKVDEYVDTIQKRIIG